MNRVAGSRKAAIDGDPGGDGPGAARLLTREGQQAATPAPHGYLIEVTVPVYNEQKVLAESVRRLHSYLTANLPFRFVITIADNASTDETFAIAKRMCAELAGVTTRSFFACSSKGPSTWTARAAGWRCATSGAAAGPMWSRIWTPTCPPASTRSFR